jgi:Peptidase family S41/N-terminal domain of Peptidase_S41 in eukaryotic IRBP
MAIRPILHLTFALLAGATIVPAGARAQLRIDLDQPDRTIAPAERTALLQTLGRLLTDRYVFPEVGARMARRLVEREAVYGGMTSSKELAKLLSTDLGEIAHDKHLNVFYSNDPVPALGGGPPPGGRPNFAAMNYAFEKVERLPGNVGYLRFDGFLDPASGAGEVAAAAMGFLAGTDALIIDLRENHGGSPAMVAFLCTYFFEGRPIHLNSLYWRPSNETQQWWTLPFVPGQRYLNKDVYLLTSSGTFSAAEEFTYNLKTQKRAVLVGETTGGGANPGGVERLSEHFAAFIPTGRAINPITKTNWEGVGVKPDVPAAADDALDVALRMARQAVSGLR